MGIIMSKITDNPQPVQQFIEANNKENIKVLHYRSFVRYQWIPITKGQYYRKLFM